MSLFHLFKCGHCQHSNTQSRFLLSPNEPSGLGTGKSQRLRLHFPSSSPHHHDNGYRNHTVCWEESLGDTTQWHFCGTWGDQGSFSRAGQGWVFSPLSRKDQAGLRGVKRRGLGQRATMWLQTLNSTTRKRRWPALLFMNEPKSLS